MRKVKLFLVACVVVSTVAAPPFVPVPDTVVHPFVRHVDYSMDNCAGTNKSQFLFGALAVMVMLGELDAITIEVHMLPGHTKMWLDWVFSKTGQAFRRLDVFNHGMLDANFLLLKRPKICVLNDPPRG